MIAKWVSGISTELYDYGDRFYLIQLDPINNPDIYKMGYSSNLKSRFGSYKTSNPYCRLIGSWFSLKEWEPVVMAEITKELQLRTIGGEVRIIRNIDNAIMFLNMWFNGKMRGQIKDRYFQPLLLSEKQL